MIPTIASRCQRFEFRKLTVPQIVDSLQKIAKAESAKIEKDALQLIAQSSEGSLRDAQGLLDKVLTFHLNSDTKEAITANAVQELLGIVDVKLVAEFTQFILEKKAGEAIDFLNKNLEGGMDPQEFAKNVTRYFRQAMVLKINPELDRMFADNYTKEQLETVKKQSEEFDEKLLPQIVENFMQAENKMKYASIIQLPLELAIIDSCQVGLPAGEAGE